MGEDMHSGQAWIVSALSLAVSYAIASLTPMNQWIGFWLRGSFYTAYQVMLLGVLLPCGALLAIHYHKRSPSLLAMTLWGAVLGYPAGLVALLLHPLPLPDGVQLFAESLRMRAPEAVVATLWFPIKLLSWAYGAMLGLLIPAVSRAVDRFHRRRASHQT
jgi:hypothetical protein